MKFNSKFIFTIHTACQVIIWGTLLTKLTNEFVPLGIFAMTHVERVNLLVVSAKSFHLDRRLILYCPFIMLLHRNSRS